MAHVVLVFSSSQAAEYLVAGIPAAARAARNVALATPVGRCTFLVVGGWQPGEWSRGEIARLAPDLTYRIATYEAPADDAIYIRGEALVEAEAIRTALRGIAVPTPDIARDPAWFRSDSPSDDQWRAALQRAGDAIIKATGKPGDGIVSRYFNRPISQSISRALLRFEGITPFHATLGTIALGIAMAASLLLGGEPGLIAGALLFQSASIFDGVDGEIARATFRTSASGAMLDSITDALTNVAFIGGLTINLWLRGDAHAASAGAAGMTMLATGLTLIGLRARAQGGPFSFDVVKNHVRGRKSRVMQWLSYIAMRDFFAAAIAVLILLELAPYALIAFSVVTAGWLIVTLTVLMRTAKPVANVGTLKSK